MQNILKIVLALFVATQTFAADIADTTEWYHPNNRLAAGSTRERSPNTNIVQLVAIKGKSVVLCKHEDSGVISLGEIKEGESVRVFIGITMSWFYDVRITLIKIDTEDGTAQLKVEYIKRSGRP